MLIAGLGILGTFYAGYAIHEITRELRATKGGSAGERAATGGKEGAPGQPVSDAATTSDSNTLIHGRSEGSGSGRAIPRSEAAIQLVSEVRDGNSSAGL